MGSAILITNIAAGLLLGGGRSQLRGVVHCEIDLKTIELASPFTSPNIRKVRDQCPQGRLQEELMNYKLAWQEPDIW